MRWYDAIFILIGLALIAAALLWRRRSRTRSRDSLRTGLADADPAVRIRSLAMVQRDGLDAHAETLLAHIENERDPDVLRAVRDLVVHHGWEPMSESSQDAVGQLNSWATNPPHRSLTTSPVDALGELMSRLDRMLDQDEEIGHLSVASADGRMVFDWRRIGAESDDARRRPPPEAPPGGTQPR